MSRRAACTLALPYTPPYEWPAMIGFLAARAIPGVEHVRPERYARTIRIGEACGTIAVRPADSGHALHATISLTAPAAVPEIAARLRRLFDLDAEPAIIARHLSTDPHLAPLVAVRPGLRVPGAWEGFELCVRAILGQQITVAAATRLAGTLAAAFGTPLPAEDALAASGLHTLFPTPEALAGADITGRLGMPRARGAAIAATAAFIAAREGLFAPGQGLEAAVARLRALPGIGEWTAQYIAMRALRAPDAFPAADVALLRAMASATGRPSPAQLLARAEAWRPWRAYAAVHLWTSLSAGAMTAPGDIH